MQRSVALDPASLEAWRLLGSCARGLGARSMRRSPFCATACRREPTEPKTLLFLGAALAKTVQREAAAAAGNLLEATLPEMLQLDRLGGAAYATERSARLGICWKASTGQLRADAVKEAKRAEPAANF